MMTQHFAMTSSLLIKILKIDKFGVFSSDIDFKTKMDIFRDDISLIINQCHLQATEGSLRQTRSVRQPRSASKRSALVSKSLTTHLLTMVVIILRIHTNSQQCTHISKETIFAHFPASEIFSIKFRLNHFYTFDHFSTAIFD